MMVRLPSVVIAVPTIPARDYRRADVERLWRERTPDCSRLTIIFSEAGASWAAGLNAVREQIRDDGCDIFLAASDDMYPGDERWLPNVLPWLKQGYYPAPRVEDPRFTNYGGFPHPVADGTPGDMSTFPILRGDWLDIAFPLPEDLHYYSDNFLAVKLAVAGIDTVAVPTCRIIHLHAAEGRGAGYGSENTRLYIDTVRYSRALKSIGVNRAGLAPNVRGGMWEEHFLEIGTLAGA